MKTGRKSLGALARSVLAGILTGGLSFLFLNPNNTSAKTYVTEKIFTEQLGNEVQECSRKRLPILDGINEREVIFVESPVKRLVIGRGIKDFNYFGVTDLPKGLSILEKGVDQRLDSYLPGKTISKIGSAESVLTNSINAKVNPCTYVTNNLVDKSSEKINVYQTNALNNIVKAEVSNTNLIATLTNSSGDNNSARPIQNKPYEAALSLMAGLSVGLGSYGIGKRKRENKVNPLDEAITEEEQVNSLLGISMAREIRKNLSSGSYLDVETARAIKSGEISTSTIQFSSSSKSILAEKVNSLSEVYAGHYDIVNKKGERETGSKKVIFDYSTQRYREVVDGKARGFISAKIGDQIVAYQKEQNVLLGMPNHIRTLGSKEEVKYHPAQVEYGGDSIRFAEKRPNFDRLRTASNDILKMLEPSTIQPAKRIYERQFYERGPLGLLNAALTIAFG